MSQYTYKPSNTCQFIVANNSKKKIRIFDYPLEPGQTRDLMRIPYIGEEDIKSSLLKGRLQFLINSGQVSVVKSDLDLIQFNLDQENFLKNAGVTTGTTSLDAPISPNNVAKIKDITNNNGNPVSLIQIDITQTILPGNAFPDNSFGAKVFFAVECTDGTDVQIREGDVNAAVVFKNTFSTAQAVNQTGALTTGTLTTIFSWLTSGNIATLQCTATSSLVPTIMRINYFVLYCTHDAFIYV